MTDDAVWTVRPITMVTDAIGSGAFVRLLTKAIGSRMSNVAEEMAEIKFGVIGGNGTPNVSGDCRRTDNGPVAVIITESKVGGEGSKVKLPLKSMVPSVPNVAEAFKSV